MDTNDRRGSPPADNEGRSRLFRRLSRAFGAADPLPIDPDLAPDDAGAPSPTHRAGAPHRRLHPGVLVAIAVGGFAGSLARYEVGLAWSTSTGHFPAATFTINTSGAFLLGLFLAAAVERRSTGPYLRPFVATGLLGGWTTYSTLAVESVALVRAGHSPTAVAYVLLSLVAGLGAAAVGIALGRVRQADTAAAATARSLDEEGSAQ